MIVLDEQLLGYHLPEKIRRWYRGRVAYIPELRPGTQIPDDAIPALLRKEKHPVFVTINVSDFWRRMAPDRRFGIVCFPLLDREIMTIPALLRRLFAMPPFHTRGNRAGKMIRVSRQQVQYYTSDSWAIQTLDWSED